MNADVPAANPPANPAATSGPAGLSRNERLAAAGVGIVLGLFGAWVLIDPPLVRKPVAVKDCSTASACVADVAADVQTLVVALALLAGAALLIALLGIRFNSIKAGEVTLGVTVAEAKGGDEGEGEGEGRESAGKALKLRGAVPVTPDPAAWERLPAWAQQALRLWAEQGDVLTSSPSRAIVGAAPEPVAGAPAWQVGVLLDDGTVRNLRLAQGVTVPAG